MKIFKVKMQDSLSWVSSGHVGLEVYVQAESFVGATEFANDALEAFLSKAQQRGLPPGHEIRITQIEEISEFLQSIGDDSKEHLQNWAQRQAGLLRLQS